MPNIADPASRIASLVDEYRDHDNLGVLFDGLRALARDTPPAVLIDATRPYRDLPEVVIPVFESVVERLRVGAPTGNCNLARGLRPFVPREA